MSGFLRKCTMGLLLAGLGVAPMTTPAAAQDVWVATHMLMPGDVLRADDVAAQTPNRPMSFAIPASRDITGQEVKRRIPSGQALSHRDVGPATLVKANTPVEVLWQTGPLALVMQGRALEPGALGQDIRVLNTSTSRTIHATVTGDGKVEVRAPQ